MRRTRKAEWDVRGLLALTLSGLLVACTPSHTIDKSAALARTMRLLPQVDIERESQLRLTPQAELCLVAGETGAMLPLAQQGLAHHFVAVGIEPVAMSYLEMLAVRPCATSVYLFYIDPVCGEAGACERPDRFHITVVQRADGRLIDQITLRRKAGVWGFGCAESARIVEVFTELGAVLAID